MKVPCLCVQLKKRGVPLNPHEEIIEIMGDSPCQVPNGFHFLGLQKLFFHSFLFGDIPHNVERCRFSFPRYGDIIDLHPQSMTGVVKGAKGIGIGEIFPPGPSFLSVSHMISFFWMKEVRKRLFLQFLLKITKKVKSNGI